MMLAANESGQLPDEQLVTDAAKDIQNCIEQAEEKFKESVAACGSAKRAMEKACNDTDFEGAKDVLLEESMAAMSTQQRPDLERVVARLQGLPTDPSSRAFSTCRDAIEKMWECAAPADVYPPDSETIQKLLFLEQMSVDPDMVQQQQQQQQQQGFGGSRF
jgi:hypothetical protein